MTDDGKIVQAAQYLVQRYAARESLDIMQQDFAPTTIADAYKVQDAFLGMLGQSKGAARRLQDCLYQRRDTASDGRK